MAHSCVERFDALGALYRIGPHLMYILASDCQTKSEIEERLDLIDTICRDKDVSTDYILTMFKVDDQIEKAKQSSSGGLISPFLFKEISDFKSGRQKYLKDLPDTISPTQPEKLEVKKRGRKRKTPEDIGVV